MWFKNGKSGGQKLKSFVTGEILKRGRVYHGRCFVKVKVPPCSVAYILGYHKTGNSGLKALAELKIGGQNGLFFFS